MERIIDFFNIKAADIISDSFWTGADDDHRNPACTLENALLDFFPETPADISIGELILMNYNKTLNAFLNNDDTYYDVTYQLLYFLSLAVIHSDNEKIRAFCDMDIKDFCTAMKKAVSFNNPNLYSILMCFKDDCFSFVNEVSCYYNHDDYDEFFYIGSVSNNNDINTVITLAAKILTSPECYVDYDAAAAYQSYIDTDGENGCFADNSEKLINDAQNILRYILYSPYMDLKNVIPHNS